jgi:sphingosine kinase
MDIGRPKRLFVLVNPFGGKRCASKIYDAEIKPMLEAAGVDVTMQGFATQMRIVFSMI